MNYLVSVIIPVYNVEKYLDKCIESVIAQTYKNIEIIIIEDGSPDNCSIICDKYQEKDSRIRVIHQSNQGVSAARNYALDIMNGEFVAFLDSDDYWEKDYVEYMLNNIEVYKADISICTKHTVNEEGEIISSPKNKNKIEKLSNVQVMKRMLYSKGIGVAPWGKMYKSELWKGLRFENSVLGEDLSITYKVFERASLIVNDSNPKMFYCIRKNSALNQSFNIKKMDLLDLSNNIIKYSIKCCPDIYKAAVSRTVASCFHLMLQMPEEDAYVNEKQKCIKTIKMYRKIVLFDFEARIKTRVALGLSYISFRFVQKMFKMINDIL